MCKCDQNEPRVQRGNPYVLQWLEGSSQWASRLHSGRPLDVSTDFLLRGEFHKVRVREASLRQNSVPVGKK